MRGAAVVGLILFVSGCSPATMGMNRMADALTATASAYARDDDPEFVRTGAPATLKMIEMMLDTRPAHEGLLQTACSGFAQYAYAFLHIDSEIRMEQDPRASRELRDRAVRMYGRARGYCLRALAVRHPTLARALDNVTAGALPLLEAAGPEDVPALYWLGAVWAGDLSLAEQQLLRIAELPILRAVFTRALALDEAWNMGAIHEAMIALEGLPAILGGSPVRARHHFDRAVALSAGHSAFAYVTYATSVVQPTGNRQEFERLLRQALAIDPGAAPELRLANLIAQRRARALLESAARLFK